ncbi:hypothetical protein STRIP9103_06414 [Streptomyces ipomoeae 91-03]|uniref:Uncharacterized protein n=1 Tax=Streptomyces ipomoeae 91-03 TaxID=698759 RepID=L1KUN9_9ACTN|nr:hypothetical protein STRIP9103_06414 [Streptomyces ipomoeae 91-03]
MVQWSNTGRTRLAPTRTAACPSHPRRPEAAGARRARGRRVVLRSRAGPFHPRCKPYDASSAPCAACRTPGSPAWVPGCSAG